MDIWVYFSKINLDEHLWVGVWVCLNNFLLFDCLVKFTLRYYNWHRKPFPSEAIKLKIANLKLNVRKIAANVKAKAQYLWTRKFYQASEVLRTKADEGSPRASLDLLSASNGTLVVEVALNIV